MKRTVPLLLLSGFLSIVYAGYDDGLISSGEYEELVSWFSGTLVVDGGGALAIEAWNSSRVEVWSTTPFLGPSYYSGITDLCLGKYSRLDYYGGETEELSLFDNAEAYLYGGRIDFISSRQRGVTTEHIFIYAQEDWLWTFEADKIRGIAGLWYDGTPFNIRFTVPPDWTNFDPAWMNIKVITPEPATLLFMALGGLLVRQRH